MGLSDEGPFVGCFRVPVASEEEAGNKPQRRRPLRTHVPAASHGSVAAEYVRIFGGSYQGIPKHFKGHKSAAHPAPAKSILTAIQVWQHNQQLEWAVVRLPSHHYISVLGHDLQKNDVATKRNTTALCPRCGRIHPTYKLGSPGHLQRCGLSVRRAPKIGSHLGCTCIGRKLHHTFRPLSY